MLSLLEPAVPPSWRKTWRISKKALYRMMWLKPWTKVGRLYEAFASNISIREVLFETTLELLR
jgi:hypothetical protein